MMAAATMIAGLAWLGVQTSTQAGGDWPQWRGPNRDGISPETGLLEKWPEGGPRLVWRAAGAGSGYSSMAVADGRIHTLGARGDTEYVIAFDASSGNRLWETPNGQRFDNDRGGGPRSTPTVSGGRLHVLGASGDLSVLDASTGKMIWTRNVLREFGGSNPVWGLSESPLVLHDRVLVNVGGPSASVVAFNRRDGSVVWKSESDRAGYSSAVTADVGGWPVVVFFTASRAIGVDARDGRLLWEYDQVSNRTANIATPIVRRDLVFLSSDYGTGCALLRLAPVKDGVSASEVYFNREMKNHHSSSVLVGDHLYGFSSAILTSMRFDDGTVAWRNRSVGKGSLVYADERLYLYSENGVVGLAEASPAGYVEHGRFEIQTSGSHTWSHPVVAGGKLYLRDQDTIYAYDVRAKG
jgi:outer membrane protein assembly factor BamB